MKMQTLPSKLFRTTEELLFTLVHVLMSYHMVKNSSAYFSVAHNVNARLPRRQSRKSPRPRERVCSFFETEVTSTLMRSLRLWQQESAASAVAMPAMPESQGCDPCQRLPNPPLKAAHTPRFFGASFSSPQEPGMHASAVHGTKICASCL